MTQLNSKQRRHLRGLAHALRPSVQVGAAGITEGVIEGVNAALTAHELIKVKVGQGSDVERKAGAEELVAATGAAVAGVIGRVWILYRPDPEEPRIQLAD